MYSRILVKHALELSLLCSSRLEHFSVHFKFLAEFECIYAYSNCTTLTLSNLHSTGLRIKDISNRENREENLSSRSIDIATDLFRSKRVRKRLDHRSCSSKSASFNNINRSSYVLLRFGVCK